MPNQKNKKKYPVLSVRVSDEEMTHIRRSSHMHGLTIPQYVRSVLVPLEIRVRKIVVDKL